jgi:hypothetical protein
LRLERADLAVLLGNAAAASYWPDLQLDGIAAIVSPTEVSRNFSDSKDLRVLASLHRR